MPIRMPARAAAIIILPFWLAVAPAAAEGVKPIDDPVFERTVQLVEQRFFDTNALEGFRETVDGIRIEVAAGAEYDRDAAIDRALASLQMSHTARYTADRVDYYELADVFRGAIRNDIRRLFPPDGRVSYEGIGIASAAIEGKRFVTDVYDGSPAQEAGLMAGDEILSLNRTPFEEIESFRGREGEIVQMLVRRTAEANPIFVAVEVARIQPQEAYLKAIEDSVRIVEDEDGHRIGVVHIWMYTSNEVGNILNRELGGGRLADVDGVIVDMRSRWGGAPADAGEIFVGGTGSMTMTGRDGDIRYVNTRFDKPVVGIIDEGSRSGMEILAYGLKKNGIPLVGANTAKAVVAGTAYLLPDDSLLILAVSDVHVDGARLEGVGVAPDIAVPFDIRYAAGADPQMDAALAEMTRMLEAGGERVN